MRYNNYIIIDIESGCVLTRDSFEWGGPVALAKSKNPLKQQQQESYQRGVGQQGRTEGIIGRAQGTLGQFEGPVQESPFYKALLTQGTEATSRAYERAQGNVRARAHQAGFGYNQPVEQGAEAELGARGASELSSLPGRSMLQAAPLALEAAGQERGLAGVEEGLAGQSLGYAEKIAPEAYKPSGLWSSLAKLGLMGASFIPGVGPIISGLGSAALGAAHGTGAAGGARRASLRWGGG